jgi:hypothetical protein
MFLSATSKRIIVSEFFPLILNYPITIFFFTKNLLKSEWFTILVIFPIIFTKLYPRFMIITNKTLARIFLYCLFHFYSRKKIFLFKQINTKWLKHRSKHKLIFQFSLCVLFVVVEKVADHKCVNNAFQNR